MDIKDKYDVIVIGAGIGGLTCGALLAKKGLGVAFRTWWLLHIFPTEGLYLRRRN